MNSKITIGLTCYNAENTIDRAIKSAISQNWRNLEIVIVDDFSSDQSWETIQAYARNDPRIKALRHSVNGGPAKARNTILENASGEILVFFDDDDESGSERVRIQYETLGHFEKICGTQLLACYASGERIYPNGYVKDLPALGSKGRPLVANEVIDYLLFNHRSRGLFYGSGVPGCSLAARVSTFKIAGGFDEKLRRVEDADFAIRLARAGGHFVGCGAKLFFQYATQANDKTPKMNLDAEHYLVEKYSDYLIDKNCYEYSKSWFSIRYFHFSGQHQKFIFSLLKWWLRFPLRGSIHLWRSALNRFLHERKISGKD